MFLHSKISAQLNLRRVPIGVACFLWLAVPSSVLSQETQFNGQQFVIGSDFKRSILTERAVVRPKPKLVKPSSLPLRDKKTQKSVKGRLIKNKKTQKKLAKSPEKSQISSIHLDPNLLKNFKAAKNQCEPTMSADGLTLSLCVRGDKISGLLTQQFKTFIAQGDQYEVFSAISGGVGPQVIRQVKDRMLTLGVNSAEISTPKTSGNGCKPSCSEKVMITKTPFS